MNKKVLCILGVIVILLLVIIFIIKFFPDEEKGIDEYMPVYKADVVCSANGVETFEDDTQEYSLRAYLTLKDNYVTKAILVGVSTDNNLMETQSYIDDYNDIDGIKASVTLNNGKMITEIEYDYEKIDLEEIREKLGYLLIDESIFKRAESLPVSLKDYQEYELGNYVCK